MEFSGVKIHAKDLVELIAKFFKFLRLGSLKWFERAFKISLLDQKTGGIFFLEH